jgi:hypothetical protein
LPGQVGGWAGDAGGQDQGDDDAYDLHA